MSYSRSNANLALPPAGFCPDSQNRCSDGAKIEIYSESSKYFAFFLQLKHVMTMLWVVATRLKMRYASRKLTRKLEEKQRIRAITLLGFFGFIEL